MTILRFELFVNHFREFYYFLPIRYPSPGRTMTGCADGAKAAKSSEKKSLQEASKILWALTVLPPALRVTSVNREESNNPGKDDAKDAWNSK